MQRTNRLPLEALEPRTLFAVFVAGNPNDGAPGSLRDAVAQANANPGPDEILLPHAQYTLTIAGAGEDANATGDLDVTDDLTITPVRPDGSTIDAGELDRVFDVRGADLTLENLTITGGRADRGGGVSAIGGSLVVTDSVFSDNAVTTDDFNFGGGAIYAESNTLTVTGSQFTGNSSTSTSNDGYGGAIYVASGSSATISGSTFTGNEVTSVVSGIGGAIGLLRATSLNVTDSVFESNTASGSIAFGGAIGSFVSGPVHVEDSVIENNEAISSSPSFGFAVGGGIMLVGTTGVIENTTITGNLVRSTGIAQGGGVYFFGGPNTLAIRDSTITGNRAEGPFSQGGGVFIGSGVATADDDTVITGNSATVGPDVFGPLIIVPD